MYRRILFLLLAGLGALTLAAQPGAEGMPVNPERPVPLSPLLSPAQLERAAWCYSLDEAMRNPEAVVKLSLTRRKLRQIPEEVFRFRNLQVLNLSHNRLTSLPSEIGSLPNLQTLTLSHNRIRVLPDTLRALGNLEHLYLGNNRIVEMPAWVGGLGKLRQLDLTYNPITLYDIERAQARLPRCVITH